MSVGERPGHRCTTRHAQAIYPFMAAGGLGGRGVFIGRDGGGGAFCYDPWVLYAESAAFIIDPMNKRVIGIVRVSDTRGREGDSFHSPNTQLGRISDACARERYRLIDSLEELDVSGGLPLAERPGLRRAVEAVEAGRADVIMVAYFDRLMRSLKVQQEVVDRVEAAGGEVLTVDFGKLTNGTAVERLTGNFLGAVAQFVREQTAEKVAEAQDAAVARGVMPWPVVPAGYTRRPDGVLEPDRRTANHVARAFEMRADGALIKDVRAYLNAHGIDYSYAGTNKLLANKIYLGQINFGRLANLHAHEPIVSRALFDKVQRLVIPKGRQSKSDRLLARLKVLRCDTCGSAMIVTTCGNDGTYPAYRCPPTRDCPAHVTIGAEIVERIVRDAVKAALADAEGRASVAENAQDAVAAVEQAQASLDAALRSLMAAGLENEPAAVERLVELKQVREDAQARLDQIGPDASRVVNAAADWDHLSLAARRELIRAVVKTVRVRRGRGPERVTVELVGQ